MPAWQSGRHIGIKTVTVYPDNAKAGLPSVMGTYMLLDGKTGQPQALIDGPSLTLRRTAAASALAARYLAREDCERLLMVGTGAMAPHLILAHASVRPICNVVDLGAGPGGGKAAETGQQARPAGISGSRPPPIWRARARGAHVISCATLSRDPLVQGDWLEPGTPSRPGRRLFTPENARGDRRCRDVQGADLRRHPAEGATKEAGDIVQPLKSGLITEDDIAGDLFRN